MSATAPGDRCPSSSWPISFAGFHVDRSITSSSDSPIARNLSITLSMSFMPVFMLPMWRSVEIESGRNPALIAGTAIRHRKLPPPWPTSKITPRFLPSHSAGFTRAGFVLLVAQPGIHVGVDVARPELLGHELAQRPLRAIGAEVHHHRNVRERPRLDRPLDRRPFRAGVVRGLDADDQRPCSEAPCRPSASLPCRPGPARTFRRACRCRRC